MSITCTELVGGKMSRKSGEIPYKIVATGGELYAAVLAAFYAAVPSSLGSLPLSDVSIDDTGTALWKGSAKYGKSGGSTSPSPLTGDVEINFEIGGATQHITQALAHVAQYPGSAPSHGGAIGVTEQAVTGTDIFAGAFRFTRTIYVAAASMNSTYIGKLARYAAHANASSVTFSEVIQGVTTGISMSFDAQELVYLSSRGGRRSPQGDYAVVQDFWGSGNVTGLTINSSLPAGNITGIAKKGAEHLWVQYKPDPTTRIPQPFSANVEKVYNTFAMSELNP